LRRTWCTGRAKGKGEDGDRRTVDEDGGGKKERLYRWEGGGRGFIGVGDHQVRRGGAHDDCVRGSPVRRHLRRWAQASQGAVHSPTQTHGIARGPRPGAGSPASAVSESRLSRRRLLPTLFLRRLEEGGEGSVKRLRRAAAATACHAATG